ncbi:MAG: hypothetical protein K1X39_11180 [Thermoflexales bacterium]|nr:hypothetical protein [Thermoflexales bacterium]
MSTPRLVLLTLGRLTFEVQLGARLADEAAARLAARDDVTIVRHAPLVVEAPDAEAAVGAIRAADPDGVVILNGTFALGTLAQFIAREVDLPILLWALPEPAEQTGSLRLNSLVGAHVNASNLYKQGKPPFTLYAAGDDPAAGDAIARFGRVAALTRRLRTASIARIGGYAPGFDNLNVTANALRAAIGAKLVDVPLDTLIDAAKAEVATAANVAADFEDTSELNDEKTARFNGLVAGIDALRARGGYDAVTIKCWGDLAERYGIAGCGAASWLNGHDRIVACEGDVNGALSLMIARALSHEAGFLTDLVKVDPDSNKALLWHIGCAASCLAQPGQPRKLHSHFAGGKGVTASFALRPGRITLFRLGEDGRGHFRLLATTGVCLPTQASLRGTIAEIHFDSKAAAFLNELLNNGWEHHLVMAYGDLRADLAMLARALPVSLTVA